MTARNELGRAGEDHAVRYLTSHGYTIIDRNWRCQIGEIDVIAALATWLVFVEVKTRSTTTFGHPFESVTGRKLQRMRRLAAAWCCAEETYGRHPRLDVIAVFAPPRGEPIVEHLKGVS